MCTGAGTNACFIIDACTFLVAAACSHQLQGVAFLPQGDNTCVVLGSEVHCGVLGSGLNKCLTSLQTINGIYIGEGGKGGGGGSGDLNVKHLMLKVVLLKV